MPSWAYCALHNNDTKAWPSEDNFYFYLILILIFNLILISFLFYDL